ncbi:MAG: LysE family translocator [Pseudohongiellaceae bacterium]
MELLAFTLATAGILALPGPNVVIVATTSAAHGRLSGMQTVAGTTAGIALQLVAAALATSWLANLLADHFIWLKWVGIAYLVWFVFQQVRQLRKSALPPPTPMGSFHRGFWIALSNPKTILFFSAFLPQFTVSGEPFMQQIALLSLITWSLALVRDILYVLLADRLPLPTVARERPSVKEPDTSD